MDDSKHQFFDQFAPQYWDMTFIAPAGTGETATEYLARQGRNPLSPPVTLESLGMEPGSMLRDPLACAAVRAGIPRTSSSVSYWPKSATKEGPNRSPAEVLQSCFHPPIRWTLGGNYVKGGSILGDLDFGCRVRPFYECTYRWSSPKLPERRRTGTLLKFDRHSVHERKVVSTPLPCPFCGHTGVSVVERDTYRWRAAQCDNCGAQGGEVRWKYLEGGGADAVAEMDAINEWNTRAA